MITKKELLTDNSNPGNVLSPENAEPVVCKCCENHEVTKLAMIAASRWELRNIIPAWFKGLGAREIISHNQSESEGNVTLTVFYR